MNRPRKVPDQIMNIFALFHPNFHNNNDIQLHFTYNNDCKRRDYQQS